MLSSIPALDPMRGGPCGSAKRDTQARTSGSSRLRSFAWASGFEGRAGPARSVRPVLWRWRCGFSAIVSLGGGVQHRYRASYRRVGAESFAPIALKKLRFARVDSLGVEPEFLNRFPYRGSRNAPLLGQSPQRGDHYVLGVHLEVAPQLRARVAASEAIGAERGERARDPASHHVGDQLEVIGHRDHGARGVLERSGEVGRARRLARVKAIPALDRERRVAELLIARDAPHGGRQLDPPA